MATHAHHLVRNSLVTAGLFAAGSLAVAGPAAAASSAAPTPVPSATAVPSGVATAPVQPSLSATPVPSETDPGSIQVPAGNAYVGQGDSGTPWTPVALLAGGVLVLGAGAVTVARRR